MTVQAGINAILYYAPAIFSDLGLDGNTTALLATGLVGIMFWLSTTVSTPVVRLLHFLRKLTQTRLPPST
jgi:hypothetical protein